jgi:hypothetical protein
MIWKICLDKTQKPSEQFTQKAFLRQNTEGVQTPQPLDYQTDNQAFFHSKKHKILRGLPCLKFLPNLLPSPISF